MSIHRYQLRSVSAEDLKRYTKAGATIAGATVVLVDVDLQDDADLDDLSDFMGSIGYAFVESKPLVPIP